MTEIATPLTYDLAGRISAATVAGDAYTCDHDAEGNQVTASKDGVVTNRAQWDPNAPLPILASEYDSAWALKQSYRYDPLGQPTATATGTGSLFSYHHDTQGSPVDVTGNTGTLYQRWSYDSFGTRVLATATSGAPRAPRPTRAPATRTPPATSTSTPASTTPAPAASPDPATRDQSTPYVSPYAYADNTPSLLTDPSGSHRAVRARLRRTGDIGLGRPGGGGSRRPPCLPPGVRGRCPRTGVRCP
ncbi:hypothetical protein [Streptomyces griseoluteus]|uniref:hypothetical protein n=1 Tax=Streptomyces griseoluteus TaxID=29306 RepID=UPI003700D584